jgi:uncharacterized membrane protein YhaH (DUF805 family)
MNFTQAVASGYRKYVGFSGRAARSEYWWWFLYIILSSVLIGFIEGALGLGTGTVETGDGGVSASFAGGPLSLIWSLAHLLPGIAVSIRRLHDLDRSGWWLLIAFVPLVGFIVLIVFYCTKGTSGANRFGPDPLGPPANVF